MKNLKTYLKIAILSFMAAMVFGQNTVNGVVTDKSSMPLIGANVFIEGSYDGTVTDEEGVFSFTTELTGEQNLSVSYLGYETKFIKGEVSSFVNMKLELRESAATLDAVEISASTFTTGDNSKLAVLTPLEVVTTAGSMGDVIAAMQTLPGTQSNADDGRLFVRGGDARETQIFIDGMRVFTPYTRGLRGTPVRGRYSPFLFKGVSFSTGGYDAQFGQALSGVLDMNTNDDPNQTETNLSFMSIGLGVAHTKKNDKSSVSLSTSYIDFTPYYWAMPSRLNFTKPIRAFSGEMVHRLHLGEEGYLKNYVAADLGSIGIKRFNIDSGQDQAIEITNKNLYTNSTYRNFLSEKTSVRVGYSFGYNDDRFDVDSTHIVTNLIGTHLKTDLKTVFSDFIILNYGADLIYQNDKYRVSDMNDVELTNRSLGRYIPGAYTSMDYYFSKYLAVKLGARAEHNSFLNTTTVDPRLTLAYKVGDNSQVSAAFGRYSQEVETEYLYDDRQVNERSTQYLLNYNLKTKKTIIRLEGYYKNYDDLLTYDDPQNYASVRNEGFGQAYGLDAFWRASGMIKNFDFWVSYSWLNNERQFLDYPEVTTPEFSTTHNFSIVTRKWFESIKCQLGLTYTMASGRPYDNPNTPSFMTERSGLFHNVSLSWSYLISQQKILFFSVSNAPGFKNEYGFRYASQPDAFGNYASERIRPNDDRFVFLGFFVTMSEDGTKNQLDTL